MEMNRRRSRGFMLAKLMPFCRAVKSPSNPSQDLYNNVHYTNSSTTTSYDHSNNYYLTHATTPLSPKVSFLLQPCVGGDESKDMEKKVMMGRASLEECVDARAASYISSVRERFKLEHSERRISLDED